MEEISSDSLKEQQEVLDASAQAAELLLSKTMRLILKNMTEQQVHGKLQPPRNKLGSVITGNEAKEKKYSQNGVIFQSGPCGFQM